MATLNVVLFVNSLQLDLGVCYAKLSSLLSLVEIVDKR
jgi:hypothetical protein